MQLLFLLVLASVFVARATDNLRADAVAVETDAVETDTVNEVEVVLDHRQLRTVTNHNCPHSNRGYKYQESSFSGESRRKCYDTKDIIKRKYRWQSCGRDYFQTGTRRQYKYCQYKKWYGKT